MTKGEHIASLLYKRSLGTLTDLEMEELEAWASASENNRHLIEESGNEDMLAGKLADFHPDNQEQLRLEIFKKVMEGKEEETTFPEVHRVHFLKTAWLRYAAAILIIVGVGAYLWMTSGTKHTDPVPTVQSVPVKQDIAPGRDGAILTLADGRQLVLDSLANGSIAKQNGSILILKKGQLDYQPDKVDSKEVVWNTMTTPRGRQFQIVLPDGTKVWLNAASSLRYPTLFTGQERKVEVTGEIYFEVAKNERMPFVVSINNETEVQVLGTHFNINAYTDESSIRTTLLQGKIKISKQQQSVIMQPGQLATITDKIAINKNVNAQRSIAWKNGVFNFEDAPFDEFMRQLARWYGLEIVYKGQVPNKVMRGELERNLQLSQILKVLSLFEVKYTLEGHKLTIE